MAQSPETIRVHEQIAYARILGHPRADHRAFSAGDFAVEEVVNQRKHFARAVLQQGMSAVDQVEFGVREIAAIRIRTLSRKM